MRYSKVWSAFSLYSSAALRYKESFASLCIVLWNGCLLAWWLLRVYLRGLFNVPSFIISKNGFLMIKLTHFCHLARTQYVSGYSPPGGGICGKGPDDLDATSLSSHVTMRWSRHEFLLRNDVNTSTDALLYISLWVMWSGVEKKPTIIYFWITIRVLENSASPCTAAFIHISLDIFQICEWLWAWSMDFNLQIDKKHRW